MSPHARIKEDRALAIRDDLAAVKLRLYAEDLKLTSRGKLLPPSSANIHIYIYRSHTLAYADLR
jgi:hypothetical protein